MLKGLAIQLSPPVKLALLLALLMFFLLISTLAAILLLMPSMGMDIIDQIAQPDLSDSRMVNSLKIMQVVNMAGGLLFPALLYVFLTEKNPFLSLKMSVSPGISLFVLSASLIILSQPFIGFTNDLNALLKLPGAFSGLETWMRNTENQAQSITEAFLATTSWSGFLFNTFMIALLPAITEEILFRGVLARLFRDWTRNIHWAAVLSAIVFSAIHLQFYGFLPRFLLGLVFAYLFFSTGSLWIPILAHFVNNFMAVLAEFLYRKGLTTLRAEDIGFSDNYAVIGASLLLSIALFLYLVRKKPGPVALPG